MAVNVTVPVKLTVPMIDAGSQVAGLPIATLNAMWAAMLAARPDTVASVPSLPPINRQRRNPNFWSDTGVSALAVSLHRKVTVAQALDLIRDRFGAERTPSRSALHRAWKRLDLTEGRR